ncbi:uncharacterized protein METZ01_LOCUS381415 [marine metagenome]|uniref:Uncharacterized protein n=1 Tax=marine metagenome TaxID=408172 RepID=A0A382U494_9ZZZZ
MMPLHYETREYSFGLLLRSQALVTASG